MANTTNYNLPYPTDYTAVADVPAAIQSLAEAADTALGDKADTSDLTSYQLISNLVTSIDSNSTDTEYPSAKCVYGLIGNIETALQTLNTGGGVE